MDVQLKNFLTDVLKDAIVRSIQEEAVKENVVDMVARVSNDARVQSSLKKNMVEILAEASNDARVQSNLKKNAVEILAEVSNHPRVISSPIHVVLSKLVSVAGGLVLFTGGLFLMKAGEIVVSLFPRGRGPRGGRGGNQRGNDTENGGTQTTRTLSRSTGFRDGRTFHESINQVSEISPITSEEFDDEFNM